MSLIVLDGTGTTTEVPDQPATPAQVAQARVTYLVELIGADGTVWDLNRGPVQLLAGVDGLFDPPETTQWLPQTIGVPGTRYTGEQVEDQAFTFPLRTRGDTWQEWRATDRAFFGRSLRSNAYATVRVTAPDGEQVTIPVLRQSSLGKPKDDTDPLLRRRRSYPDLVIVAPQPYWEMPDVAKTFTFDAGRSFYRGAFRFLGSGASARTATLTNPGDVDVFTRAVITGPATAWSVGFGTSLVSSTSPLADGEHIHIDGRDRSIRDDTGARAYKRMDQVGFPTAPPGVEVPVVATMTGYSASKSSIEVAITPLRERPL